MKYSRSISSFQFQYIFTLGFFMGLLSSWDGSFHVLDNNNWIYNRWIIAIFLINFFWWSLSTNVITPQVLEQEPKQLGLVGNFSCPGQGLNPERYSSESTAFPYELSHLGRYNFFYIFGLKVDAIYVNVCLNFCINVH